MHTTVKILTVSVKNLTLTYQERHFQAHFSLSEHLQTQLEHKAST